MISRSRPVAIAAVATMLVFGVAAAAPAQGKVVTKTFSSGNLNVPISTGSFTALKRKVKVPGKIRDVDLSLRMTSSGGVGALGQIISLRSPAGLVVGLVGQVSGSGYGSGAADCSGTPTVFDDEGALLGSVPQPFATRVQPSEQLAQLDGYSPKGVWDLQIAANYGAVSTRAVHCWGLTIRYKAAKRK